MFFRSANSSLVPLAPPLFSPKGDPLDNRYVYLNRSMELPLAGEGLFAREDIPPDTVFVLYSGHILTSEEMENFRKEEGEANRRGNISANDPAGMAKWKYRHNIRMCNLAIDIPPEYGAADHFRATLGHKINHKFDPTTVFVSIDSARLGKITILFARWRSCHSLRDFFQVWNDQRCEDKANINRQKGRGILRELWILPQTRPAMVQGTIRTIPQEEPSIGAANDEPGRDSSKRKRPKRSRSAIYDDSSDERRGE